MSERMWEAVNINNSQHGGRVAGVAVARTSNCGEGIEQPWELFVGPHHSAKLDDWGMDTILRGIIHLRGLRHGKSTIKMLREQADCLEALEETYDKLGKKFKGA